MIEQKEAVAEPLRLPDPGLLFEARAARLRALAAGHPASDFLLFLSRVATGQRDAVRELRPPRRPALTVEPPLAADRLPRDETWRRMLGVVLSAATARDLPAETHEALRRLAAADAAALEALANAVLAGEVRPRDVACAPFVGAALQAWFGALASQLDPAAIPRGSGDRCPVCASPPVAAVVGGADRLRYLSCGLCGADWNVPRIRCTLCAKDAEVTYFHVEGDDGAKAEACGACRAYVKVFDELKRPGVEAAADDAATLALDLLLGEDGWRRAGVNLYLASAEPGA